MRLDSPAIQAATGESGVSAVMDKLFALPGLWLSCCDAALALLAPTPITPQDKRQ